MSAGRSAALRRLVVSLLRVRYHLPVAVALTLTSVVSRADGPSTAVVRDSLVVFNEARGKYLVLDDIAWHIWRRLDQPLVVAELCRRLAAEFDIDLQACQSDVLSFLSDLESRDLLRVTS